MPVTVNYRPEIDGLRAIAVLVVVFYHAGFGSFQGGFVGVDVFFVISGFLITQILSEELAEGPLDYLSFYDRRIRRILPALFVMLLMVIPPAYFLLPPDDLQSFANSLLGATWFSSNFVFWAEAGYFDRGADAKPLLHTWSLAVEEQFYLFFPLLLSLLTRWGRVVTGLALGSIISIAVAQAGLRNESDWPFFMLVSRAWELGLGALAAVAFRSSWVLRFSSNGRAARLFTPTGLALIAFAVATYSEQTPTPGPALLLPTVGAALILLSKPASGWAYRILSCRILSGLGLVSYAFYLWHQPMLVLARFEYGDSLSMLVIWSSIAAAFVMSVLSFNFIERPFRDRQRMTRKTVFLSVALAALLITGLGISIKMTEGHRQRSEAIAFGDAGHSEYYRVMDRDFKRCNDERLLYRVEDWEGVPRCHLSLGEAPLKVAFFGDSHAEQLFLGAEPLLATGAIYLIRGGLPFVREDRFRAPFFFMQQKDSLEVVVFSAYWTEKIAVLGAQQFVLRVFETVKWLVDQDLKVVLMMDTPDFGFGPERCLYPQGDTRPACSISYKEHQSTQDLYRDVFQKIAKHPSVELVDVSHVVCGDLECSMVSADSLLYRDNDHLNLIGSDLAGRALLAQSAFLQAYAR